MSKKPHTTPRVALIGRPNVGKSSLFNKLVGRALALVDATPGLTRDRQEAPVQLNGGHAILIDTPGLEEAAEGSITSRMRQQTEAAVEQADLAVMVVDGRAGVTPLDKHYAAWLRAKRVPILLVVNKCEGKAAETGIIDAYGLGFGEPITTSASHNDGLDLLREQIADALRAHKRLAPLKTDEELIDEIVDAADVTTDEVIEGEVPDFRERPLMLAIVGRPNAGKSTLVNALLGEERMLVGPEAGLTRDSVRHDFEWPQKDADGEPMQRIIRLADTAGLRRRARVDDKLEKMGVHETLRAIRLAHVVVLVIDAAQVQFGELDRQDLEIARHVINEGRALVLALNKWDLVTDKAALKKALQTSFGSTLSQVKKLSVSTLSALKGRGLDALMGAVLRADETWNIRISTGRLNRWLARAIEANSPPMEKGRRVKIRYATQLKARPPTFALWCSRPNGVPDSYLRYLSNSVAATFDLAGIPLRLQLMKPTNPYA